MARGRADPPHRPCTCCAARSICAVHAHPCRSPPSWTGGAAPDRGARRCRAVCRYTRRRRARFPGAAFRAATRGQVRQLCIRCRGRARGWQRWRNKPCVADHPVATGTDCWSQRGVPARRHASDAESNLRLFAGRLAAGAAMPRHPRQRRPGCLGLVSDRKGRDSRGNRRRATIPRRAHAAAIADAGASVARRRTRGCGQPAGAYTTAHGRARVGTVCSPRNECRYAR